jgi:hypothetical protein
MNNTSSTNWSAISARLRTHKWATVAVFFLVLLTLVISLLPVVISSQLQKWLLANGADEVSIENVDFNPFTAELAIYDLTARRKGAETLKLKSLQVSMLRLPLFEHRVVIPQVLIDELAMSVDLSDPAALRFGGISLTAPSSQSEEKKQSETEWSILVSSLVFNSHQYAIKKLALKSTVNIARLKIDNLDTAKNAEAFWVDLQAHLNGSAVNLSGKVSAFVEEPGFEGDYSVNKLEITPFLAEISPSFSSNRLTVSAENALQAKLLKNGELTFSQQGKSQLQDLIWKAADTEIHSKAMLWSGSVSGKTQGQDSTNIKTDGKLGIVELAFKEPQTTLNINNRQFDWSGKTNLILASSGNLDIMVDGQLDNHGLQLKQSEKDLMLINEKIKWHGDLTLQKAEETLALLSSANAELEGLKVSRMSNNQGLISASHIKADSLRLEAVDKIHLEQLAIHQLRLDKSVIAANDEIKENFIYTQDELILEQLDYSTADGLAIKQVEPSNINANLYRSKSGVWHFEHLLALDKLAADAEDGGANQPETEAHSESKVAIRIEKISLKNQAKISYIDHMLAQGFKQHIVIESLEIDNIDNTSMKASPVKLKAKLDKASINVEGSISLFAAAAEFDFKADIKALSMLPYSSFMEKALGYQVDSGILSAKGKFKGAKGKLESETDLTLNQLDIKPLTEAQLKKLGAKQNSGLETGLSMLKDKNDTIKLKLPVNGKFDNLKVDPGDIINQALGSALKSGAKTYFAAALFPFGTLLVIADAASDKAMQVKLDPVVFTRATGEFDVKYHEYLQKVAAILEEKPEIYVKVCGVASPSDRDYFVAQMKQEFLATLKKTETVDASKEQRQKQAEFSVDEKILSDKLTELAKLRAAIVSDYMINNAAVKVDRLVDCQPRLELDNKKASPRADLLL